MERASDSAILVRSRAEQRVVVTADLDYPQLLALSHADGPGVILFRGGNFSEQESLELLKHTMAIVPLDELPHVIVVVEKGRIRLRRLPL